MAKVKTKVTLIGAALAKPGLDFVYEGNSCPECENCKVRKTCHNLQPGRRYRVATVRTTRRSNSRSAASTVRACPKTPRSSPPPPPMSASGSGRSSR